MQLGTLWLFNYFHARNNFIFPTKALNSGCFPFTKNPIKGFFSQNVLKVGKWMAGISAPQNRNEYRSYFRKLILITWEDYIGLKANLDKEFNYLPLKFQELGSPSNSH
jgi:hypothetical protein